MAAIIQNSFNAESIELKTSIIFSVICKIRP